MSIPHKWQFSARFRRQAFGWRSDAPIQRIKEAMAEIKKVTRKEPVLAAEGAVTFLVKLSPALVQVDSSSGAISSAVNRAIEAMVPIIAKAPVDEGRRQKWLDRLWGALQDDDIPYLELLGDYWGELCASPTLSAGWVDRFLPTVNRVWGPQTPGEYGHFSGTTACLASIYAAGQYDALLSLLEKAPFCSWHNRRWGVRALVALGRKDEALRYAEASKGLNAPVHAIASACEAILLSDGLQAEAYQRYARLANQGSTHLATFRLLARKYPAIPPADILGDLIASTPGSESQWFAAAKDAGLFDVATRLATSSPVDPRTLSRAARDFAAQRPDFAVAVGLAALHWIAHGHGYDITSKDVLNAYDPLMEAAPASSMGMAQARQQVLALVSSSCPFSTFLQTVLGSRLR
jgi:hypothetical protein